MLLVLIQAFPAPAAERLLRRLGVSDGLPVPGVHGIVQDEDGYLWLGTHGGLVRYDGQELRLWSRKPLTRIFARLLGPQGELYAFSEAGELVQVVESGITPVAGPDGSPLSRVESAVVASDGALWVVHGELLLRRTPTGEWRDVTWPRTAGPAERLRRAGAGAVYVGTEESLWHVPAADEPRKIIGTTRFRDVAHTQTGSLLVLDWPGVGRLRAIDTRTGRVETVFELPARPIDLTLRGDTAWIAFDHYLAGWHRGASPLVLGREDGIPSAGHLFIDREGSLWSGSVTGAIRLPEPDTAIWTAQHGLPETTIRWLDEADGRLWIRAWDGTAFLPAGARDEDASSWDSLLLGDECVESSARIWFARPRWGTDPERLVSYLDGRLRQYGAGYNELFCASSGFVSLWMSSDEKLFTIRSEGSQPQRVPGPPDPLSIRASLLEDDEGWLWTETVRGTCRTRAKELLESRDVTWSCSAAPEAGEITDLFETEGGRILASTRHQGVLHHDDGRWRSARLVPDPPTNQVEGFSLSPSGGLWVFGSGFLTRVQERAGEPLALDVVERLTSWHGLPSSGAADVLELDDGTVWVGSHVLARVPSAARQTLWAPPPVVLSSITVAGEPTALAPHLEVPFRDNHVVLRFAALSFRDPGRLRYRVRSRAEAPWTETTHRPSFHLADLAPGDYQIEVAASLDGERWSSAPATLALTVNPPWYLTWWFLLLTALALGGLLYLTYRVRVAFLLRLERQRLRIAMDLHDEVGSGLGSVGIMGELVASEDVPAPDREALGRRIASSAQQLGDSLADIVWALRAQSGDLDSVLRRISERARDLFLEDQLRWNVLASAALSEVPVSLPVRRNVTRIAHEALHNAAKHGEAAHVEVGLEPRGRRWCLWIRDDGRGFDPSATVGDGLGMTSMRRRADQIGAVLEVRSSPDGGTLVLLTFSPRARDRRTPAARS